MNSPELAALGVRPEADDLYVELLRVIKENDLGREVVTNGFVLEIKGRLRVGRGRNAPGQMSSKQACHILAFLADPGNFPSEDSVNEIMRLQLLRKKDLDSLKVMLDSGEVLRSDSGKLWRRFFLWQDNVKWLARRGAK